MSMGADNRVLVIDDDEQLISLLSMRLSRAGYTVDTALSADEGYNLAIKHKYGVIILDVMMPKRSGSDVCKDLRTQGILTPILMLSGKTEEESIIQSLEAGADDYLTKPFSHEELIARLKALVRRNKKAFPARRVRQNDIELDIDKMTVRHEKEAVALTNKETRLLQRLMYDSPRPVTRQALLEDVWGINDTHASNKLDVYILRLRKKMEMLGNDSHIHTMRGRGYSFGPTDKPDF